MNDKTLAPGDSLVALCSRCKDERRHTVVAVVGGVPVKVQCDTCKGVHVYKTPKGESPARQSKPRTTGTASAAPRTGVSPARKAAAAAKAAQAAHDEWERKLAGKNPDSALPYAMTGCFAENSLVMHPTFGLGVVAKTIRPDKMEVIFEAGTKLLRCVAA